MKVSSRTQLILAATVFFFIITLFIVANTFIQSTYAQAELQQSDASIQLVSENIQYEMDQLGMKARDWAVWDDTYQFMEDKNRHYCETVIDSPTTYESLELSGMILYDGNGRVVASQGYHLRNKTRFNISDKNLEYLSSTLKTLSNTRGGKKKQGLVMLPEGPSLVGMHTVLRTSGMGEGHGTLVMIQPFDERRIVSIQNRLHLPVKVWAMDSPHAAETPYVAALAENHTPPRISRIENPATMQGLFLLSDIMGRPALLVEVETPRTASQKMQGTLIYLIAAFAFLGVIFIAVTGLLLKWYIITPLTDLDAAMKNIGRQGDLTDRLPVEGDDEVASLKESFNAMLQKLQDKETELKNQASLLAESHRKANLYLDIYLDVLTYEILNVTISLQAYAELIRQSGDMTNKEYADRITAALNRNLSVIRNIETISKIYKHPPGRNPLLLRSVVDDVIRKYPGRDIRYRSGDVRVLADEMLGTVFYNILQNSFQFGKENLFVEISVRDISTDTLEVSVVDNGTGIADDMKPLIFDRFMKDSDKRSSYGLGLHIVKMLVEAYGGRVWAGDRVAGRPEEGAAIRFTLKKG